MNDDDTTATATAATATTASRRFFELRACLRFVLIAAREEFKRAESTGADTAWLVHTLADAYRAIADARVDGVLAPGSKVPASFADVRKSLLLHPPSAAA